MCTKKSALTTVFGPSELVENAGLVRLGDRFGSPVLSSSGTGASLSFQDIYKVPADLSVIAFSPVIKALKSHLIRIARQAEGAIHTYVYNLK